MSDALERLTEAVADTRRRYVPGTPEKYPRTPIHGAVLTDVEALLAERDALREQLDAARQALEQIAWTPSNDWHLHAIARAALGVVGEADDE